MDDYSMDGQFDDWDAWSDQPPTDAPLAPDPQPPSDPWADVPSMGALSDTPFQSAKPDAGDGSSQDYWPNDDGRGDGQDSGAGGDAGTGGGDPAPADDPNTPPPGSKTVTLDKFVVTGTRPPDPPDPSIDIVRFWGPSGFELNFGGEPPTSPEPPPPPAPPWDPIPPDKKPPIEIPSNQAPAPGVPYNNGTPKPPVLPKFPVPPKPPRIPVKPVKPGPSTNALNGAAAGGTISGDGAILIAAAAVILLLAASKRRAA